MAPVVAPVIAGQATATRQVAAAWERRGSGVGALTSAVVNNVALVIIGQAERRWRCSTPAPPGSRRQGAHYHDRWAERRWRCSRRQGAHDHDRRAEWRWRCSTLAPPGSRRRGASAGAAPGADERPNGWRGGRVDARRQARRDGPVMSGRAGAGVATRQRRRAEFEFKLS